MFVIRQIITLSLIASFGSLPFLTGCNTQAVVSDFAGDVGDGMNASLDSDGDGLTNDVEVEDDPQSLDDSGSFDVARILDGQWVLTAFNGTRFACMIFEQGHLVFYGPFCQSLEGVMPDRLFLSNDTIVQDESIRISYVFVFSEEHQYLEVVDATFVNENLFDVFVTTIDAIGDRDPFSVSGVLAREPF